MNHLLSNNKDRAIDYFIIGILCLNAVMLWLAYREHLLSLAMVLALIALVCLVWQLRLSLRTLNEMLDENQQQIQSFMDHSPALKIITDKDGKLIYFNETFARTLNRQSSLLIGKSLADVFPSNSANALLSMINTAVSSGNVSEAVQTGRRNDGSNGFFRICMYPFKDTAGQLIVGTVLIDITERMYAENALRVNERRYRSLVEATMGIYWTTDRLGRVIGAQSDWQRYTGQSDSEIMGHGWVAAVHPEDEARLRKLWRSTIKKGYPIFENELRIRRYDGIYRDFLVRGVPVMGDHDSIEEWVGICIDITENKRAEERLFYLAHHDHITSLPNRVLFQDRLKQTLAEAQRNQKPVGVLFLDLDRFKLVNDTLGHEAGNRLLKLVSQRLTEGLRDVDTICRIGGDEFAIVLAGLKDTDDAGLVSKKVLFLLSAPFDLNGNEIFVTTSIGIAAYPIDGTEIDTLIKKADAAMYAAKALGGNNYHFYTTGINERALEKVKLEARLRRAIERQEFVLHYQPKMDVASGAITGLEALLRWQSSDSGLISPSEFIPLLEETGLIVQTGKWVVNAACAQIKAWQQAGIELVPVAVNLSARQFQQLGLDEFIRETLMEHSIDPSWLEIEITESTLMHKPEEAIRVLNNLSELGIRIAVDDFGTGYSSLSYLKRFPLDALKIDRSFVRDVTSNPDDEAITCAILTLAQNLGLKVVAEGVETEEQLAFLAKHGCNEIQGFLLSKPLPDAGCAALLSSPRSTYVQSASFKNRKILGAR